MSRERKATKRFFFLHLQYIYLSKNDFFITKLEILTKRSVLNVIIDIFKLNFNSFAYDNNVKSKPSFTITRRKCHPQQKLTSQRNSNIMLVMTKVTFLVFLLSNVMSKYYKSVKRPKFKNRYLYL